MRSDLQGFLPLVDPTVSILVQTFDFVLIAPENRGGDSKTVGHGGNREVFL